MGTLFYCLALLQDFLPNKTHIAKISFRFLETKDSTVGFVYELLVLSRAPQDITDTVVYKVDYFFSDNLRTGKLSYSKKDIFHSVP